MEQSPKPRLPGPPYNPWLRELVSGKQRWSGSLKPEDMKLGFRGWHERGYLPHRDEPGLTQFVTFRVRDSFPSALRAEWEAFLKLENDRERRKKLELYLDQGRGGCPLRTAAVGTLVDAAFRFHDGVKYDLRAWVVMPN